MKISETKVCPCHGEPMVMYGGEDFWRCHQKRLESRYRYNTSFKGFVRNSIRDAQRWRRAALERD